MSRARAFTLIELLVVISIIALLSSVVLASLNSARSKARVAGAQQFAGQAFRAIGAGAGGIWDFEAVSGASIEDRSGNGNTGTINGTASFVSGAVPASTAIGLFNDAYVLMANSASLNPGTSDFTVALWLRTAGYVAHGSFWNVPIGKGDCCSTAGYAIRYDSANIPRFTVNGDSGYAAIASASIADDEWHHIAGVRSGTSLKIYVDGRESGSTSIAAGANADNASQFYIGKDSNGVSRAIRGYVDNAFFAPSALTASEIQGIYAAGARDRGLAVE